MSFHVNFDSHTYVTITMQYTVVNDLELPSIHQSVSIV